MGTSSARSLTTARPFSTSRLATARSLVLTGINWMTPRKENQCRVRAVLFAPCPPGYYSPAPSVGSGTQKMVDVRQGPVVWVSFKASFSSFRQLFCVEYCFRVSRMQLKLELFHRTSSFIVSSALFSPSCSFLWHFYFHSFPFVTFCLLLLRLARPSSRSGRLFVSLFHRL
ncbi:hypothetical protein C8J56DRAFT_958011 [Mycena floridula]|nr:hypothetical protein C8J56DRAFT_958011 [Mycena floridula]